MARCAAGPCVSSAAWSALEEPQPSKPKGVAPTAKPSKSLFAKWRSGVIGPPLLMLRKENVPRKVRHPPKIPTLRKRRSLRKIRSVQAGWGTRQTWFERGQFILFRAR